MSAYNEINSDNEHVSLHGVPLREVTDTNYQAIDNVARQLIDEGWNVEVKTGTHGDQVYFIMYASKAA